MNTTMFALVMLLSGTAVAEDWRSIRGNDGTGTVSPGGVLSQGEPVELRLAWKKQIGSGYSSVVVSGGKVFAMYSENEQDVIACLNKSNGTNLWKTPIGPRFVGKNGSFDGPVATPFVDEDMIYVLSPLGKLICFKVENGDQVWSRDLQKQDQAPMPLYGFTTSPIVYKDQLIVQTGTKDRSLAAYNKSSGELVWSCTDDRINSQTPTLMQIGDQPALLVAGGKNLFGVNPEVGTVLFEYVHEGGNGSAMMPVVFENNKVLLTLDDRFSKAVSLRPDGEKINVSAEWQQPSIKNTYNVPAIHDGNAYAYSTRILTSVDTQTGKANWKSRKPGDGFLIIVDGHMIINTKKGGLYIAPATREKFEPIAELKVFDDLVWSIPAYSENAVYLRSLGEIARVDIVPVSRSVVSDSVEQLPMGQKFAGMIERVASTSGDQQASLIDEFLKTNSVPFVESDVVHFLYRGDGQDVAVASDIFGARQERKMKRIGNSNLFYYTARLPRDQRANYVFVVDYKMTLDASNQDRVTTSSVYAGEMEFAVRLPGEAPLKMNWFSMSEWVAPPFVAAVSKNAPKLVNVELESEPPTESANDSNAEGGPPSSRPVSYQVLLPPGYESSPDTRYHVVYIMPGSQAIGLGSVPAVLEDIFNHRGKEGYPKAKPCIAVFTDNAGPELADRIVPSVDAKFRTVASREGRSLIANAFMAGTGFSTIMEKSDMFSGLCAQSPLMFDAAKQMLRSKLEQLDKPIRIYMDWGNFDLFNPDENWDMRKDGKEVFEMLRNNQYIQLAGGEVHDSTDWISWRSRLDKVLDQIIAGAR